MQLEDWLDDLCVRFIINLPPEELASVERICFQIEEAQWFYEDFIRPLDPSLPSLGLRLFYLRITQRCPLFREWGTDHHTKAFEQFLAYKQRVPVRGAILLNEKMDEVLLVKGWKKGANWSFPRGKINKDENDLDCAIREVYEETGFDIREAGLVKAEKKMKYIEVTMREQHMRLYVFKGVPRDTHFAPRTRKEISKIEWYKLTDLPTLKKKQNSHEGTGEHLAINANKFYMVAPFLHPLKKWIAQEKKKDAKHGSNLAAPPILAEETATEDERGVQIPPVPYATPLSPPVPSSLPEVSHQEDPLAHLKAQLNMPSSAPLTHVQNTDPTKSNALLALLRNGSTAEMRNEPQTPMEQLSFAPEVPRSSQRTIQRPVHTNVVHSPPPPFQMQPHQPPAPHPHFYPPLHGFGGQVETRPQHHYGPGNDRQPIAPYQHTGETYFHTSPDDRREAAVPSANALPKLTHHTKALLDAFKNPATSQQPTPTPQLPSSKQDLLAAFMSGPTASKSSHQEPSQSQSIVAQQQPSVHTHDERMKMAASPRPDLSHPQPTHASGLLDLLKQTSPNVSAAAPVQKEVPNQQSSNLLSLLSQNKPSAQAPGPPPAAASEPQQPPSNPLLDLLRRPVEAPSQPASQIPNISSVAPAELSATPAEPLEIKKTTSREDLLALLGGPRRTWKAPDPEASKAGHTGSSLTAPLNQPQFDAIQKAAPSPDEIKRSPVASHRKLFDPKSDSTKQQTPVKVLSRHEESRQPPKSPKSPRTSRGQPTKSPKRPPPTKEVPKAFQPQILKRPQISDSNNAERSTPSPGTQALGQEQGLGIVSNTPSSFANTYSHPAPQAPPSSDLTSLPRKPSQPSDSHKQGLLSLLKTPTTESPPPVDSDATPKPTASGLAFQNTFGGTISPLTASQMVSPIADGAMDPATLRSRVSSLASTTAGAEGGRPQVAKRQTAEGDKLFLLNYLGKIASQEAS